MKTKIHALAGGIAFLTILSFWSSTIYAELFTSHETIAMVKGLILQGMFILIPAMIIVGASGRVMASGRSNPLLSNKMKRMPIIAITGLVVLLPAAFFLETKASNNAFDMWFYIVQAIELIAGASNLRLMLLNIQDGLRLTGKLGQPSNSQAISINPQDNGPLIVQGCCTLTDADGNTNTTKKVTALCRCGSSKNKPYCDGSHNAIGFMDTVAAEDSALITYKSEGINVHYNKQLCSHAGKCGKRLKAVFNTANKPWIQPNKGTAEEIKMVIQACPSGALSFSHNHDEAQHILPQETGIYTEKDGPLHIRNIEIILSKNVAPACAAKYVLCRCGASKNKPYCDGSHVNVGWKDS